MAWAGEGKWEKGKMMRVADECVVTATPACDYVAQHGQ